MKKDISKFSNEELKNDLKQINELEKLENHFEEKYSEIMLFGNAYGLKKRILEELGKRSLQNQTEVST